MRILDRRCMSDARAIKEALNVVKQMEPVVYTASDTITGSRHLGVTAQSLVADASTAVDTDIVGTKSVDMLELVPVLVAAVQELSAKVEALEARRTTRRTSEKAVTNGNS